LISVLVLDKRGMRVLDMAVSTSPKKPLVEPCFFQWSLEFLGFPEYGEVVLGNWLNYLNLIFFNHKNLIFVGIGGKLRF
jgi:hypothetical protein